MPSRVPLCSHRLWRTKKLNFCAGHPVYQAAIAAVVANTGAPAAKPTVQPTSEEFEKKIRNLNKKLRQIDALVEKKVGGAALQVNQQEKIKDRPAVEAEIAELTAKMNAL